MAENGISYFPEHSTPPLESSPLTLCRGQEEMSELEGVGLSELDAAFARKGP